MSLSIERDVNPVRAVILHLAYCEEAYDRKQKIGSMVTSTRQCRADKEVLRKDL